MSDQPGQDLGGLEAWKPVGPPSEEEVTAGRSTEPDERTGTPWGLVAVLILATLVVVFIVQNNEPLGVEFLGVDLEISIWIVILAAVLITLINDQVISLFYRRRKGQTREPRSRVD